MNKIRNIEELSGDMLNDDFIRIFQPIFFVLRILGLLRVNIKYRYPTAPTPWYRLYSNIFWILNTFCVVYFFLRCENIFRSKYADSTLKFVVLMNGINGILLVCRNNLRRGNKIGQMYVKLQKIERYLNMKNAKSLNKLLGGQSACIIVSACFLTILWLILFNTVFVKNICIPLLVNISTGIGLHAEMAQVYYIIHLITTRVNYINDLLRQETAVTNEPFKKSIDDGKLFFLMNTISENEDKAPSEVVSAMHCIFEALAAFTELFQFSLFYFVCEILAWNLVSIHYLVTSMKEERVADFDLLLCVMPLLLKQLIMFTLCFKTETLSTKLEDSRKLCIDIVSSCLDDVMKTMKDNTKIEYLSKDILDDEFMKSFRLTYYFQILMASTRVDVKDRFVTTTSFLQKCHTLLTVILLLGLDYVVINKYDKILFDNETIYYLSTCVTGLQTLTFLCNIIHVRFMNADANVELHVKLQQIDRCMNIDRNKSITDLLVKTNIVSLVLVLIIFITLLAVASAKGSAAFWPYLGIAYSQLSFVIELVGCSNMFTYFFIRARFVNSIIKNYLDQKETQEILYSRKHLFSSLYATKIFMRRLAAGTHNFVSSDTDVYLKQLLDGFFKFQDIYKFQIFLFCCKLVASSILTFEFLLFAVQNDTVALWDSLTPSFFTIIDLVMALLLGIRCEVFIREVKETKRLVITVMSIHYDGRLREKSKRMLKLIEETPPRFSVYDMWQLDANILLQMFMLVTGLIVTQMQFAFL